jgi:hypothetical protein
MADAMQAANEALQNLPGMGAANPGGPTFTPEQLRDRMPESAGGLPRTDLSMTNSGMPGMSMTNVQAEYQASGGSIEVSITDMGAMPGMAMASAGWAMTTFDRTTATGFERTSTFEGYKSMESQNQQGANVSSELSILAGNFLVQLHGYSVPLDRLKAVAGDLAVRELGG